MLAETQPASQSWGDPLGEPQSLPFLRPSQRSYRCWIDIPFLNDAQLGSQHAIIRPQQLSRRSRIAWVFQAKRGNLQAESIVPSNVECDCKSQASSGGIVDATGLLSHG